MIYGKSKIRNMQRSILPSTARKQARIEKLALVHHNRRKTTHSMAGLKGPATYVEDLWDDDTHDLTYWMTPKHWDYGEMIYERRAHDKLAHFEVWAYKRTKHLRPEDRYSKMAGILPSGVIGRHALNHLDFLKPPHPSDPHTWLPRSLRPYDTKG